MGAISVLCVVAMVFGLILILLGAIGPTARYVPHGVPAGIALLLIGGLVYLIIVLTGSSA